ncbi:hypothetical protein KIN20_030358 [Parelaphostrongylus tenuis]|uniref:Uncharacterized protein n=1 Tax=Parelaphostrongylus tenuis TaxID=148309 RepID=A0AAD5R3V8_PARTN|nr:hypothetical protein KIN20_030358 [Parelaphostrongylus tenuis]
MVYSGKPEVSARVPGIAASREAAEGFVSRLVMQAVGVQLLDFVMFWEDHRDVLERQGRRTLLPDAIISNILDQLTVNIMYEPMVCQGVVLDPTMDTVTNMEHKCNIVGNTVTGICASTMVDAGMCTPTPEKAMVLPIPANRTSIQELSRPQTSSWQMVDSDVAKCSEPSCANVGIEFIWISFLIGNCHRRRKLRLSCDTLETVPFT